jgi:carnitine 3-dehydrogenase
MSDFQNTAILGAGVIGMSWAALFLASGRNVAVFDTAETEKQLPAATSIWLGRR